MYIVKTFIGVMVLLFLIFGTAFAQNRQKTEIRGVVLSIKTGEKLAGASISVKNTVTGTTSDANGEFSLLLEKGAHTLVIAFLGYASVEKEIVINQQTSENKKIKIELDPDAELLDEVVISSRDRRENVTGVNMGVERMNIKEIQRLPVLMGEVDILKAVQLLPGVQSTAEGSSGFSVRGGSPDQNLILFDNATVYNASHLLGFFSVFNNDIVSGLELYKGDLPLKYGGRLSSLLNVHSRSETTKNFQASGGIGLISTRLLLEGNIKEKTSWFAGGRRSYADMFLVFSPREELKTSSLYFYDFNAKITHRFSQKDKLEISGYLGKDLFGAEVGNFKYGNSFVSAIWKHTFSNTHFSRISFNVSNYNYGLNSEIDILKAEWMAGITDFAFQADFDRNINRLFNLNYGFSSVLHKFNPGHVSVLGYPDYDVQKSAALEHAAYISNEQKLSEKFSIRYGLRFSVFQNIGSYTLYKYDKNHLISDSIYYGNGKIYNTYGRLEPRLGAVFLLDASSSIKANYTHNAQYIQLAENSSAGSPVNIWFAASPNIKPQTVDMFSAGYFRNFKNNTYETSVEMYYKKADGVIDFAEHAQLILNQHLERDVRIGTGKSYGIEFMIKKNSGKLTGFVNYTLARSERSIPEVNNGKPYLAPYDKTHAVNIALNYEFSKKWNVSTTWVFATGTPTTYPTGRFEVNGEYFPIYSGRNEYRRPDYHRLDFSVNFIPKPFSKKRWKGEWNFSLYNVYGRKNPWLITYIQTNSSTPKAQMTYLFQFVPSVTYNFKF
jgi:hypothetical protein